MTEDPLDIVDGQRDPTCSLYANFQHLRHWTEGYIAHVRGVSGDCPYPTGGAREVSWSLGVGQARVDTHM